MTISLSQLAALWAIIGLGSIVQGTIGFASGMLALPILLFAGWTLPEAIAINLVAGVAQNLYGTYVLRRAVLWPDWLRPNLVRLAALPVGVWALTYADRLDLAIVRQLLGAIILAIVTAYWLWRVKPRECLHVGWEYLTMGTSGFFAGFCGVGGPQMVLWLSAQLWPPQRTRAFLHFAFSLTLLPQALLLVWNFEEKAVAALQLGVLSLPAAITGVALGMLIGNRLPRELLRRLMLAVLAVVAASAIVVPLL